MTRTRISQGYYEKWKSRTGEVFTTVVDVPKSKGKRSRYTPPPQKKAPASPTWVAAGILALIICGIVVVVINYLGLLPGDAKNRYLLFGLVLFTLGFMSSTNLR